MYRTLSNFDDDIKLGGVLRDPSMLEKWADRNLMKFHKGKCEVLQMGRNNPRHQYIRGTNQLESSFAEKDVGVLVDTKLNMSQATCPCHK